jgi:hypothetical protein
MRYSRIARPHYPLIGYDFAHVWSVEADGVVVFSDGSAILTGRKNFRLQNMFEVSLGDYIIPEYPLGIEPVFLNFNLNAQTGRVRWCSGRA